MIHTITGNPSAIERLKDKSATYMLAMSNTATAEIAGITQAGIPGMLHLTPILDAEFLCTGAVYSLPNIAETPKGVPTPALITRAVHLLHPFAHIELLDLGLKSLPKVDNTIHHFDIPPSGNIAEGAGIDAKSVFEKGFAFGKNYVCKDDYLILSESVPSGTTTATATALALGYDARGMFSSSFKEVPDDIRRQTIDKALAQVKDKTDIFEILGGVSDNMLLFNAGLILGISGRFPVVLAGGTQMAAILLVANRLREHLNEPPTPQNVILATTKWVAKDTHSDIKGLLEMVDSPIDAIFSDFDFVLSNHPALKLYDAGEAKEGVGAGGALVYGMLNGLDKECITRQVEAFLA